MKKVVLHFINASGFSELLAVLAIYSHRIRFSSWLGDDLLLMKHIVGLLALAVMMCNLIFSLKVHSIFSFALCYFFILFYFNYPMQ